MVSKKGKRKLDYEGKIFYWFIRKNSAGRPKIHILSEDKKVNLVRPFRDTEEPVTPGYIRYLLNEYYEGQH